MRDNGVVVDVSHRDFGPLTVVAHPATFSASARPPVAAHAPNIGEHNQSILKNVLRFSDAQALSLRQSGAVPEPNGRWAAPQVLLDRKKYREKMERRRSKL